MPYFWFFTLCLLAIRIWPCNNEKKFKSQFIFFAKTKEKKKGMKKKKIQKKNLFNNWIWPQCVASNCFFPFFCKKKYLFFLHFMFTQKKPHDGLLSILSCSVLRAHDSAYMISTNNAKKKKTFRLDVDFFMEFRLEKYFSSLKPQSILHHWAGPLGKKNSEEKFSKIQETTC